VDYGFNFNEAMPLATEGSGFFVREVESGEEGLVWGEEVFPDKNGQYSSNAWIEYDPTDEDDICQVNFVSPAEGEPYYSIEDYGGPDTCSGQMRGTTYDDGSYDSIDYKVFVGSYIDCYNFCMANISEGDSFHAPSGWYTKPVEL
jgi:hypothetical protein